MGLNKPSTSTNPLIIAHRGVSGHRYENTMPAFSLAVDNTPFQADGIELDFHTTFDGHFLVHHDPVVPSGRAISEHTLADLRSERLPDGSPVPTLHDVLPFAAEVDLFLEAKGLPPSADSSLLELLAGWHRLHVHSFDHRIIARLAGRDPKGSYGILSASYPVRAIQQLVDAGATTLWQEWPMIDDSLVEECHTAGMLVYAWTVNDHETASRLRKMRVDGLCGNWPERLRFP